MESPSMPDLCLAELDLSLTECNCQSGGWSDWHLNLLTEESTKNHPVEPKTCWGEREGEIPHKGCSRSTLDLIWSPPSIKDLSDPVNLVQIWLISIKLAENPLIYDSRFAPLLINLLIKILNNWFLGLSDPSDGKSLKTRKKWVHGFTWCS